MHQKHRDILPDADTSLPVRVMKPEITEIPVSVCGDQKDHQVFGYFNYNIDHKRLFYASLKMPPCKVFQRVLGIFSVQEMIRECIQDFFHLLR